MVLMLNWGLIRIWRPKNFLRYNAFCRWRNSRSDDYRDQYCQLRNSADLLIRDSKRRYYSSRLSFGWGFKALWENLRLVGLVSTRQVESKLNADDFSSYLLNVDMLASNVQPVHDDTTNVQTDHETSPNSIRKNLFGFDRVTEFKMYFKMYLKHF